MILTIRFLDVENFTDVIPLSLLISCKISFSIISFQMFLFPTENSYKYFSVGIHKIDEIHTLVPHKAILNLIVFIFSSCMHI
jgi:hypothetical protein